MVGVAVNVNDEPAQVGLLPVVNAMETDGVTDGNTVTVMLLEFADPGLAQFAFDVIVQLTT